MAWCSSRLVKVVSGVVEVAEKSMSKKRSASVHRERLLATADRLQVPAVVTAQILTDLLKEIDDALLIY